ncbi:uncharacterized protein LOC127038595 isoform X2 [Gopherus flavomarginatus]|uniref:uncharacterized protein LOC127038595 isoform X2 n=1 Tax=Gopherus flavomarginatus TaxID=286002 RepID=UPI0021CBF326|nr:uncharacterized protein LOC127038595 isoform X2 [Gopherus flavomarginatus]
MDAHGGREGVLRTPAIPQSPAVSEKYLHSWLSSQCLGDPTTTSSLSMDTRKGGVSHNTDEDFVHDDEENVQQASRQSVLPGSQDLFITLEPIPSQGELFLDPEDGEGISEF